MIIPVGYDLDVRERLVGRELVDDAPVVVGKWELRSPKFRFQVLSRSERDRRRLAVIFFELVKVLLFANTGLMLMVE